MPTAFPDLGEGKAYKIFVILLFFFVAKAQATPKVWRRHDADVDSTTLGVLTKPSYPKVPHGIRAAQQPFNPFPYHFRTQAQPSNPLRRQEFVHAYTSSRAITTDDESSPARAPANSIDTHAVQAKGAVNIYGEPLKSCGPSFLAYNPNSPLICVRDIRAEYEKNASWSNDYTAKGISIWDYAEDSEPTMYHTVSVTQYKSDATKVGGLGEDKKCLENLIKCDALPSDVLDSQYTLDLWEECELIPYANVPTGASCERFRNGIERICKTCGSQAKGDSAKESLQSKCDALTRDETEGSRVPTSLFVLSFPSVIGICSVALIVLFFSILFVCRAGSSTVSVEPLLAASR